MAIWQVDFTVIPKEKELVCLASPDKVIPWEGYCIKDESLNIISKILTPKESWCKEIRQFGNLDETCIELYYHEKMLEEIRLRIDLRSVSRNLLEEITAFLHINNAVLLTDEDKIIQPVLEAIVKEIKNSKANKFLRNPEEFLQYLGK